MRKLILILFLIIFLSGCVQEPVACTQDAKLCPDGTYVGRVPPDCEFAPCPKCSEGETLNGTCPDGTPYLKYSCGENGEWHEVIYVRNPCESLPGDAQEESVAPDSEKVVVGLPEDIENNCIGFLIGAPDESKEIADIGGAWTRPHHGPFAWEWIEKSKGNFDFEETDMWVKEIQRNDIAILATIWPFAGWDQESCHGTECEVGPEDQFYPEIEKGKEAGIPVSRCSPCNLDDYKNFLTKLVDRYDGDGIDDMPGLTIPIKYWEILNEPSMDDDELTFYKGTQEEYVGILKASNEAIKATCPDCKIVQGGASGIGSDTLAYWGKIFDLGGSDYFDIANIHFINFGDPETLNVKDFKELMDGKGISKPIWVTEAQYKSENEVEPSVDGALNAGASKIFFVSFTAGQMGPPMPGRHSEVYERMPAKCA